MLVQRFPQLTEAQIMVIAGIPREEIRHTRAVQDWLAEGRQEGRQEGEAREAAKMTLRLLSRRCGPLTDATTAQIQALPLEQLESWPTPCSTSKAQPTWPPGWPPISDLIHQRLKPLPCCRPPAHHILCVQQQNS